MFSDASGGFSSIRVLCAIWILVVIVIWTKASIHEHKVADIPINVVALTSLLVCGKVVQRFGEGAN